MLNINDMPLSPDEIRDDIRALIRDKYDGDVSAVTPDDITRVRTGEPLAYVVGWQPFLGLRLNLSSRPLIPRPETEWWANMLIEHLRTRFSNDPFTVLDMCAGSGAIGLAVASHIPNAHVTLSELSTEHAALIRENADINGIAAERIDVRVGSVYEPLPNKCFDVIATNPPYIPASRTLPESVVRYEPSNALYAGSDGLAIICTIAEDARKHVNEAGELWMEADIANIEEAARLLRSFGARQADIVNDQYDRPRLVVSYW